MKYINFIFIFIYALFYKLKCVVSGNNKGTKTILIIFDKPGIGDILCLIDALYNMKLNFGSNYHICLATTKNVINFLKSTKCTFNFEFLTLELENKFSMKTYKLNLNILQSKKWDIIISFTRIGIYIKTLLVALPYNRLISGEFTKIKFTILERLLNSLLPNYFCCKFPYSDHWLTANEKVFSFVCNSILSEVKTQSYKKIKIPILCLPPIKKEIKYIMVCPTIASNHPNPFRSWSVDNYVKLCNKIIVSTDFKICLSGTDMDYEVNKYVENNVINKDRIINLTGKTTFKEWIELIRNASFLIGNDSGYIHLAARLDVQSFAISGYWNYGRFLPYPKNYDGVLSPIDIRTEMVSCESCSNRYVSPMNLDKKECTRDIKLFNTYKCIHEISVEMVENCLFRFLNITKK